MLFKGNSSKLELLIGKIQAHKEPQSPGNERQKISKTKETLGTGSSSWNSEDGRPILRNGGEETPSSCATPTSASFPSEPEVDADVGVNADASTQSAAPYSCQFCDRTFPRLSYLKKHEQSHGDQMPYRCSWCARLFKHKRSRDRHVKLHTGDRRYRCSHCEAAFSRSDHLKIHMKTHDTQKPYQCTACSRGYNTAAALTSHMQSHKKHPTNSITPNKAQESMELGHRSASSHDTSSPVALPKTPSPNLSLNSPSISNNKQLSKLSAQLNMADTSAILNSPLKLTCMYCTRDSFTSMQQLQLHVHSMHQGIVNGETVMATVENRAKNEDVGNFKYFEEKNSIGVDYGDNFEDERSQGEGFLNCSQCTMKFSSLGALRDHLVSIHHRSEMYTPGLMICPLCGASCSSTAHYAEHYVLQHCEKKNFTKEYLESEPADLTSKHLKSTSETSYSAGTLLCGQCGAALKDFESFREHLAGHLKADQRNGLSQHSISRFHCPKCDALFHDKEDMLAHLTKHFLGQVTKEYACNACGKFYIHPDLLQRHLLDAHVHHLYRCALCKDTFDSRVAIQVHFAVKHSQECQVYHCNACDGATDGDRSGDATLNDTKRNAFRTETEMANHVRSVHVPPQSVLEENTLTNGLMSSATTNTLNSRPKCIFCGLSCSSDLELQLHLASHTNSLYRCPICHETFAVEFLLDKHIAQTHNSVYTDIRTSFRENGRIQHRSTRSYQDSISVESRSLKRGRSPASSNNNSLHHHNNNNKRANYSLISCEVCERAEFTSESELQAHRKLAHAASSNQKSSSKSLLSLSCAYCGEVCRSRADLETHTRIQHSSNDLENGRHKCNICDEVCASGAILAEHKLQKHCKIQLSDVCIVCRGIMKSEEQFLEHVQGHSLEGVEGRIDGGGTLPHLPAPCVVCRQTLISDLECRMHARHHLRAGSKSNNSSPSPKLRGYGGESQCCICLREFADEDFVNLPSNRPNSRNQMLKVCKSCYLRYTQGLSLLSSPYEPTILDKSSWIWSKYNNVNSHCADVISHENNENNVKQGNVQQQQQHQFENSSVKCNGQENDKCKECGVKIEDNEEAQIHHRLEHESGMNTYTCIQCQMTFPTEAKIQQHVKKEHLDLYEKGPVDLLRCHLCLFDAVSPLQLQGHLIEHTFAGCSALSCYICQALFTTTSALQNHMVQEHGLNARPYDCSSCGLKFFFRTELDHHCLKFHQTQSREFSIATSNVPHCADALINADLRNADDKDKLVVGTNNVVVVKEEMTNQDEEMKESINCVSNERSEDGTCQVADKDN